MSPPDLVGEVRRSEWGVVKGLHRCRKPITVEGEGLLARALQYEAHHLDGVLFVTRIEEPTRLWRVSELSVAAEKEVVHI